MTKKRVPWTFRPALQPITVEVQGTCAKFRIKFQDNPPPIGAKRGLITTFTPAARLRLMKKFHAVDWDRAKEALFVTLTYPDPIADPDIHQRKAQKKEFVRLIEQETGQHLPAVWRLEWESRKSGDRVGEFSPHWHFLIFNHRYIDYKIINLCWAKAIGWDGYVRTEITRMRKESSVRLYLAKYISKDAVSPSLVYAAYGRSPGKAYGYSRPSEIPMCPMQTYTQLTEAQIRTLMALAEEQLPWVEPGTMTPWTALGELANDVSAILSGRPLDKP